MSKKEACDSVIYDIDHLPDGFVPLGKFCGDGGATPQYGQLDRAFRRGDFKHGRFKCRGKLYAHQEDIDRCLQETGLPPKSRAATASTPAMQYSDGQLEAACKSLASIDTTLDEIYRVLERLTTAVENIATQPKAEPVGTWRDMNGEVMN